jgi:methionyl-tRNA formyltransferase
MTSVIASNRLWSPSIKQLKEKTGENFVLIKKKDDMVFDKLQRIKPQYIFFTHWSYTIPKDIYKNFECVIFHMTDLPFGRGGSPLQNLIVREIYETKVTALKCVKEIDAGDVYFKKKLSLFGSAEEIFIRASEIVEEMIVEIMKKRPLPEKQTGDIVNFKRRRPEDGDIASLSSLKQVFDYIRMLDAEDYPNAFLNIGNFKFEFSRAALKKGKIIADVSIEQLIKD